MSDAPDILFRADVGALLRLTPRTLARVIASGALDFAELPRLDRHRRYSRPLLLEWIAKGGRIQAPPRLRAVSSRQEAS